MYNHPTTPPLHSPDSFSYPLYTTNTVCIQSHAHSNTDTQILRSVATDQKCLVLVCSMKCCFVDFFIFLFFWGKNFLCEYIIFPGQNIVLVQLQKHSVVVAACAFQFPREIKRLRFIHFRDCISCTHACFLFFFCSIRLVSYGSSIGKNKWLIIYITFCQ